MYYSKKYRKNLAKATIILAIIVTVFLTIIFSITTNSEETTVLKEFEQQKEIITKEIINDKPINTQDNKLINEQKQLIDKLANDLQKYKSEEKEKEIQQQKIKALQNPDIVTKEMNRVGKLVLYESKIKYDDIIAEKGWFTGKELNLDLQYRFGYGIDLSQIKVVKFIDDTVVLSVPLQEIKLTYLELNVDKSTLQSKYKMFSKKYSAEDIDNNLEMAEQKVRELIHNTQQIKDECMVSLKENLSSLLGQLGYKDVIIESL